MERSRAWAEAWGAALVMVPTWVLASVVAWLLRQWDWLLVWVASGRCRCRRRCTSSHRSKNIDPPPTIHVVWRTRSRRIESNRCEQPSYSRHRGSQ